MTTRKISRVMITLLLAAFAMGQTVRAQIPDLITYTVTGGSSLIGDESCRKLLDGDIHTKWCEYCGYKSTLWVEFKSSLPFVPTGYILTTGNDNALNNYRNPQKWRLKGRLNENSEWEELAWVEKDQSMEDKNLTPYEFELKNPYHKTYQYFKFEVYDVRSYYEDYLQLSEFQFKGYVDLKMMNEAMVTGVQPVYDYNNGEHIQVDYTVQDALGNTIDPSNYNAHFELYDDVAKEGEYRLVLAGKNDYFCMKNVPFRVIKQLSGSGTEASPYLISTSDDWNLFAERVREGDTYQGKYVKLNGNVDVTTMAGSSEVCSFQGTFDGGGNTINVNLMATEDACAPFRYLKDAKIMNLNFAGKVESSYSYAASLAAYGYGTCAITNCGSTAEISSTRTSIHKDYHGGFIAVYYPNSSLTFTDCVFAGKMTGSNSWAVAGFVGYSFATVNYNHCLYAGTEFTMSDKKSYSFNGNSDCGRYNGVYVTKGIDCWYGTKVYSDEGALGKQEFEYQGTKYCTRASVDIKGIESSYDETGSEIVITPTVYYDHQQLTEGQDYEVTTTPAPVQQAGNYTMSITGKGDYAGTEKRSFRVNYIFTGDGSENNPYLIPHSAAWEGFAVNLQNGMDYAGKYVKQTDDFDNSASPITVTAGSEKYPFKGTFLGNGRTLTINLSGKNKYLAPFSYIENATIRDLTVTGTITSTVEGDGTHGGFAGVNNGNSTFTNCTFTGRLLGAKTTSCGGFVGWNNDNLTYEDCLFNPAEITMSTKGSATFNRNGMNKLTRCYYTTSFGEVQGVKVSATANAVHTSEQIQIGGVDYYRSCDISGLEKGYKFTGSPISVKPVVKFEGQTLTENTDYTVSYKNSYDEEVEANKLTAVGKYTITITGMGNYTGTYTADFYIVDKYALAGYLFQTGRDDEGEYYEISTATDWNALGLFVADSENGTTGMRFKLTDNISVTTMIGTNVGKHSFQGTFDGNGKTLTVTLSGGDNDQYLAPFRYLTAATIRNMVIAGTITSTMDGEGSHGGFTAINKGETTFENCAFKGSLLGVKAHHNGGFVGLNDGKLHFIDCLFAPAEITMSTKSSATFNCNARSDFLRTYYVTCFGREQGTRVYDSEVEGVISQSVTAADGNTYYVAQCFGISSASDWQTFAELVEAEDELVEDYPVVLLSDITVDTTVGSLYHPFMGAFFGNGKTITVNLDTDQPVVAPFCYVGSALIQNLTIAGTIKYTEQDENGACGGFVGVNYGNTIFNKCIFTGSLLKGDNTSSNTSPDDDVITYCGGFVGSNYDPVTFRDCLFNPTEITVSGEHVATFYNDDYCTMDRAYYLKPFGKAQGRRVYLQAADVPDDVIAYPETFFNGTTYYVESSLKVDNTIADDQSGHYYVNMPTEGKEYFTIPAGIKHFKVYDDGGKEGKASRYCDAELVLTAPSGCQIQATGTLTTSYYYDEVALYNGTSYRDDIFGYWSSDSFGVPVSISRCVTAGENLDVYFYASYNADTGATNLDLVMTVIDMPLKEEARNDALIAANEGKQVNAVLFDRELYVDDDWNTICLPFSLSKEQIDASLLTGAVIKELDTEAGNYAHPTGYADGTLYLNFKDATSIEAGKPYLIKWASHPVYSGCIPDPAFVDVTVTATTPSEVTSTDGYVSFVGTYSPVDIFSADKTNLYVGSNNRLHYPWKKNMEHFDLYSCRGYFRLHKGLKAGEPDTSANDLNIMMNFDDNEATGIRTTNYTNSDDEWYTLSGTRLNAQPTQKGLYIKNGRKVVIK